MDPIDDVDERMMQQEEKRITPQLECRPQDLQHFFNGPVWRDVQRIFEETAQIAHNQLADLNIRDQVDVERTRAQLNQIKWLQNDLPRYMIGIAEGQIPE